MLGAEVIATLPHHEIEAALQRIPLTAFEAALRGYRAVANSALVRREL
jgi:hypothetical protein